MSTTENSPRPRASLAFVRAVNVELTYRCDLACDHCLQRDHRSTDPAWIDTASICRALTEARFLGFTRLGVNLTGGEPFIPGSNLPELLRHTRDIGLPTRVNTNCRWALTETGPFGGRLRLTAPRAVLAWLQEHGLAVLALSLDNRYEKEPDLWTALVRVIRACEESSFPYQMIVTGIDDQAATAFWRRLLVEEGVRPAHLIPVPMERVDLGAARGNPGPEPHTWCEGRGFFRPTLLHISPNGGVRSCLYATGADWLGNITRESLTDIAQRFSENPVVEAFRQSGPETIAAVDPTVRHPCARAVTWIKHRAAPG